MAAMVLVFAPAAPVLYFIGGGTLLVWAAMQKLVSSPQPNPNPNPVWAAMQKLVSRP